MDKVTGKTLIDWGFTSGAWFAEAVPAAEALRAGGADEATIRREIAARAPPPHLALRATGAPFHLNIRPELDGDADNIAKVSAHMKELMRLPTVAAALSCQTLARPDLNPARFRLEASSQRPARSTPGCIQPTSAVP